MEPQIEQEIEPIPDTERSPVLHTAGTDPSVIIEDHDGDAD